MEIQCLNNKRLIMQVRGQLRKFIGATVISYTISHAAKSYKTKKRKRNWNKREQTRRAWEMQETLLEQWLKWGAQGGSAPPPAPVWAPCNSMSPLIESVKCYFMPK